MQRWPRCGACLNRRAVAIRRAWPVARTSDHSLATPIDSLLETDWWRLSSRPQDGRPDPRCRVLYPRARNRIHGRSEALDLHVPGSGDKINIAEGWRRLLMALYPTISSRYSRPFRSAALNLWLYSGASY